MALTNSTKAKIRLLLGYPTAFRYAHTRLESILSSVPIEDEELIEGLIAKVEEIDAALIQAGTEGAGIARVDEIWFHAGKTRVSIIQQTGRQYIARISTILGVPINGSYYGGDGYSGDSMTPGGTRYGNGRFYGLG